MKDLLFLREKIIFSISEHNQLQFRLGLMILWIGSPYWQEEIKSAKHQCLQLSLSYVQGISWRDRCEEIEENFPIFGQMLSLNQEICLTDWEDGQEEREERTLQCL